MLHISLFGIRENIFACLFSVHNRISLSCHEQVCVIRMRFERYFSHHHYYSIISKIICDNILALQILLFRYIK